MAVSSGSQHADWFFAGGSTLEGSDKPLSTIIPLDDVTILDTWKVMGLAGTGTPLFSPANPLSASFTRAAPEGFHLSRKFNVSLEMFRQAARSSASIGMFKAPITVAGHWALMARPKRPRRLFDEKHNPLFLLSN
jgi:alkylation response protein AidB-like acyl-CoA dehydrogenase